MYIYGIYCITQSEVSTCDLEVRAYPRDDCTVLCVLLLLGWVLSEVGGGEGALVH